MSVIFVSGIDTGIGKTIVTGLLGRHLAGMGRKVITAKIVQTGSSGLSEDIVTHRKIMQMPVTPFDEDGLTCPYTFPYPASPHLAARLAEQTISTRNLTSALDQLSRFFETVIVEGVGGIFVPLTEQETVLDFISQRRYPTLVVTSPKLGSINHTLLTVESLQQRRIPLCGLVYNLGVPAAAEVTADTRQFLQRRYPHLPLVDLPALAQPGDAVAAPFARLLHLER